MNFTFTKNKTLQLNFRTFLKKLKPEIVYVIILGLSFILLQVVLSNFIPDVTLPVFSIYIWLISTLVTLLILYKIKKLTNRDRQLVLFYFGIGIMTTVNYLQFINYFSENLIFFYWTMAVLVSLGITDFRLQIQIWAVPLLISLFTVYYCEVTEAEKLRIYIWNPVITIISCFGVYSSLKTQLEVKKYKLEAEKFEFEFENLLATSSTMIIIKDDKNRIVRVNKKYAEMFGEEVESFENINLYDMFPEEDALRFHKTDLEIITTGKGKKNLIEKLNFPNSDVTIWLRMDKMPYYNSAKEIIGIIIFSHDITEEIKAKKEKEQTEAQYEQVFSEAPYGILIFDKKNNILQINSTFEKMTGFEKSELIKLNVSDLIDNNSLETPIKQLKIVNGFQKELEFKTKYDGNFIAKFTVSVVNNNEKNNENGKKLDYSIGIIEDITEKKNAEKKLANYSNALAQSNKDLEQFAYAASHDLKEPLRMVNSYVTLIAKKYSDKLDQRGLEFIGYASDGVKRMNGLIHDLLEYSRVGRSEMKNDIIIFDNLIMKVMNNLRVPINEKKVDIDISVDLQNFQANGTLIAMLFQNIISNGIKYNENQPIIKIRSKSEKDFIQFSISDNGIGIDKKFSDKIFQVFQRLHSQEQYEGSGIGLAICKRIIQKHGGKLWVESEINQGSTFYFTISKK